MAFDVFLMGAVNQELNERLITAKITKIYQPDRYSISLNYHHHGTGEGQLFISAHPVNARINISRIPRENPQSPASILYGPT